VSVLLAAIARPASAQSGGAADKATAEVLFDQGKALLVQGKLAEACPKLAESLRLDTGIGTMLYLAECYERSGKTASAWAEFREAQASAARDGDARGKVAKERADKLEPTLSYLTVVVPPESELEGLLVTRDGTTIGRAGWGIDAPTDPGPHVIRASAPGREPQESTIEVGKDGARARFVVAALVVTPGARPLDPHPTPIAPIEHRGASTQRTVGIGIAAAGVVGLGVATFFGVKAIGTLDDSKPHCGDLACDQAGLDLRDDSRSQANVSTILFVASGVVLAGGVVLWVTAPASTRAAASPSRSVAVAPVLSPWGAALSAVGRF
jgi:hypothetical protein